MFGEQTGILNYICNIKGITVKQQTLKNLLRGIRYMQSKRCVFYVQLEPKMAEIYRPVGQIMPFS